ncbi:hypothetical protein G6F57_022351 [Rhizopus arrhizus]|nr:hypothetical protein G6F68_020405 [Rhizopus microsporus]KAG1433180.1 hypothetical protein G6F57_022351 [Rhizopus arrhizus]
MFSHSELSGPRFGQAGEAAGAHGAQQFKRQADGAQQRQQIGGAGHLAVHQHGERQGAKRHELALGNENDARDGENQHQSHAQQGIDSAVDDTVLQQDQRN